MALLWCGRALVLAVLWVAVLWVAALASPASADAGPWGWPLAGQRDVARPFAPPASTYGTGHRGVDLASVPGAAVRASAAGRVTYAGLLAGRGVVVVTHGALRTTYEPVTATVRAGQAVALGEVVGRLEPGHLGCRVSACLHWGLRRGEQYLDPVRLVERGPIRLLPLDAPRAAPAMASRRHPAPAPAAGPGVDQPAPPPQAQEPAWSVRAADAPLGAAAVVALVLGVGLLARPRPVPPAPAGAAAALPASPVADAHAGGLLVDLDEARARRRAVS